MDYKKEYKEALERAKAGKPMNEVFPELKESEDDRIRKEIITLLQEIAEDDDYCGRNHCDEYIAYLEKQKDASKAIAAIEKIDKYIDEQVVNAHDMKDSNPDKKYYRGWDDALGEMSRILQDVYSDEKQKEQKPAQLVLHDTFGYEEGRQTGQNEGVKLVLNNPKKYGLQKEQKPVHTAKEMWKEMRFEVYAQASGNRHEPSYSDDSTKMFSLCDIDEIFEKIDDSTVGSQPAESDAIKGGDFISDGKRVFLVLANVKERNLGETGSTFCEGLILGVDGVVYCNGDNFKKFNRATSDERAKFIHDLKVGVELKEQPAEWSEEDDKMFESLHACVCRCINDDRFDYAEREKISRRLIPFIERLKSLRPQPHWKPSEDQMDALEKAWLECDSKETSVVLSSLMSDLQKLL